jgi:hypothetical protein
MLSLSSMARLSWLAGPLWFSFRPFPKPIGRLIFLAGLAFLGSLALTLAGAWAGAGAAGDDWAFFFLFGAGLLVVPYIAYGKPGAGPGAGGGGDDWAFFFLFGAGARDGVEIFDFLLF